MKSWQTTLAGIAAIVAAIANAIVAQFDTEPLTVPDWPLVIAAISAGIGLIRARDNDKSSEDVGAKPRTGKYTGYSGIVPILIIAFLLLGLTGCAADKPFLYAADHYHRTVGEHWTRYVQTDPSLSEGQKRIRIDAHEYFRRAIEARKQAAGD